MRPGGYRLVVLALAFCLGLAVLTPYVSQPIPTIGPDGRWRDPYAFVYQTPLIISGIALVCALPGHLLWRREMGGSFLKTLGVAFAGTFLSYMAAGGIALVRIAA